MKRQLLKWLPPLPLIFPALLSGALLSAAFPPIALGGITFVALIPLIVSLYRKPWTRGEAFRAGFFFGLIFFLLLLWWIVKLLPWANVTIPWLMTPALILLVLYLSLYPAFFCLLLVTIGRGKLAPGFFVAPALWTLLEIIRSRGELGFPWGVIGYGLSRHVNFIQGAAWVGLFGVGFIVVLISFVFSAAFVQREIFRKIVFLAVGAGMVAALGLHGWKVASGFPLEEHAREVSVAVIQPNVSLKIKWDPAFRDSILSLTERLSRIAASANPGLIIFPETSAPVYIHYEKEVKKLLTSLVRDIDTPIYIGFLDARRDWPDKNLNIYNSSGLFTPDGRLEKYDKTHLLPFGEALPLSWKFRFLKKINFGQANFQPGKLAPPIDSRIGSLGPLICFESIFPELSRRYARAGADFFVNITNDGWFGNSPGPYQHAEMCVFRAVENRRYLLRSANTGVSMVVNPVGSVASALEMDREGMLVEKVRAIKGQTFYTRAGEWPVVIASLLLLIIGAVVARRSLKT
ncbi:MAG: apolipoprotein N-acyltransferase [Candidatus Latescibacteria bacterium]|nr:apolipoprotein N-acyltransferase [Candidatus Latescibacterota bacterium]NIM22058.1 apolipoprotein N-acyltransferase [Candidatus Latescibacterota bacterium]NIM66077.1 apolipoprotein N-acyltransferase [Candidatus Latescibacterota bacterium]NIO02485.1 apolipoprotein N-acyltransferase [Candidatus Latescibacterota bacterium]NIO29396.1 apolipoprotein N-acyltransferase [Candidatus Latescibacterota bacterium]